MDVQRGGVVMVAGGVVLGLGECDGGGLGLAVTVEPGACDGHSCECAGDGVTVSGYPDDVEA